MGEIINLRRARKARNRVEREKQAEDNRRAHGRTKAEKALLENERLREERFLEGHLRRPEKD